MGGCYSTEKPDAPEYSTIFGPRAGKGEVHKSQVDNSATTFSWEDIYRNKQILSFWELHNSQDAKHKGSKVTNYFGDTFIELAEKSFSFELLGQYTPALNSTEFIFSLESGVALSPVIPNSTGGLDYPTDSHNEFPSNKPGAVSYKRQDIPELKPVNVFGTKAPGLLVNGASAGSKHQYAHVPANILAEADEYERASSTPLNPGVQAPGPTGNIAIDAYLETFTASRFKENLLARYQELIAVAASLNDPPTFPYESSARVNFREPSSMKVHTDAVCDSSISASMKFSTQQPTNLPSKVYPGIVSPPFLVAAGALVSNNKSWSAQFGNYAEWVNKQRKFQLFVGGEWNHYPTGDKIALCEENKLPLLSFTGRGEYWLYLLESAYLRSMIDLRLEPKVQSLSYALKDIVGCPIQEVNYKAIGLRFDKFNLLLRQIW